MTRDEVMAKLESLGSEKQRGMNVKSSGADDNQFGAKMGDIRNLGKEIKLNPELAAELWKTGNWDARLLATLLLKPAKLSVDEVEAMVSDVPYSETAFFSQLGDWVMTHVVKPHPQKEELRQRWMVSDQVMLARAGWSLTAERLAKNSEGLDAEALLERIEKESSSAHPTVQWTMNYTLAHVGIYNPHLRDRAVAMGHKLGMFRDYPVSKGCTSPFAPIWIEEMVKRQP